MSSVARRTAQFTALYILFFLLYEFYHGNYEFIFYSIIIFVLLFVLVYLYRRIELSNWIIVSLSVFGLLHLAGGNLTWHGTLLYDLSYLGDRLHFDNIVHMIGVFLATLILYNLIYPFIDQRVKDKYIVFYLLLILMALGLGTINEIVELTAVVFLGVDTIVGDYYNNALDLVFNCVGAVVAVTVIHAFARHKARVRLMPD